MANPSVTYTFTNGTTADGTQVSQNFTDLINGLTDGTKSLNIDAITAAGAATFNGNTIIGNSSGDTSTVNATMSFATTPKVDIISEKTSGAGVTIDGVLLKDNTITASGGLIIGNETLSVYDEGTWSPTVDSVSNIAFGSAITYGTATFTRIGNTVFARLESFEASNITITDATARTTISLTTTDLPGFSSQELYGSASIIVATASPFENLPVSIVNSSNLIQLRITVAGTGAANGDAVNIRSIFIQYKV